MQQFLSERTCGLTAMWGGGCGRGMCPFLAIPDWYSHLPIRYQCCTYLLDWPVILAVIGYCLLDNVLQASLWECFDLFFKRHVSHSSHWGHTHNISEGGVWHCLCCDVIPSLCIYWKQDTPTCSQYLHHQYPNTNHTHNTHGKIYLLGSPNVFPVAWSLTTNRWCGEAMCYLHVQGISLPKVSLNPLMTKGSIWPIHT